MITVITRSLNEEHRVSEFCLAYHEAHKIIIADGGSTDNTVKLAERFGNVEVIHFDEKIQLANGHWRNPDSMHVNFAIAHAKRYNPLWIILDDIDCRPNYTLRKHYFDELYQTNKNFVMVPRLYLWGLDKHFPRMAQPAEAGKWEPSLWAWRGNLDLWTVNDNFPHYSLRVGDKQIPYPGWEDELLNLYPPQCLLHYTWDNEERVNKKLEHHRSGLGIGMRHPLEMGGPLEDLPDWSKE